MNDAASRDFRRKVTHTVTLGGNHLVTYSGGPVRNSSGTLAVLIEFLYILPQFFRQMMEQHLK
jgi:hypothetical protein